MQILCILPAGAPGHADRRLTDIGFGLLNYFLMTRKPALARYRAMAASPAFNAPLPYVPHLPRNRARRSAPRPALP
ncbi:hypothetical protein SAMN05192549_12020 [Duganella sacchari]|uniref:Uncharacterized protein n=1 Tax=Duganella sacchari TaxID=551987 RepID=A0A1M7RCS4_9BURK|nr:hypothetical protein [Duganella sacchari]SHN44083.1 hypothetical protein SAMN05192549_12020 [Duganella sacchari]